MFVPFFFQWYTNKTLNQSNNNPQKFTKTFISPGSKKPHHNRRKNLQTQSFFKRFYTEWTHSGTNNWNNKHKHNVNHKTYGSPTKPNFRPTPKQTNNNLFYHYTSTVQFYYVYIDQLLHSINILLHIITCDLVLHVSTLIRHLQWALCAWLKLHILLILIKWNLFIFYFILCF